MQQSMIRSFRSKSLASLWNKGDARGIRPDHVERVRRLLTGLHGAAKLDDVNIPGWGLHKLKGKPVRYALSLNGPWRAAFEWRSKTGEAASVDLEQYH